MGSARLSFLFLRDRAFKRVFASRCFSKLVLRTRLGEPERYGVQLGISLCACDCSSGSLMEHLRTSNNPDHGKNGLGNTYGTTIRNVAGLEEKKAAVQAEISRVNRLPSNSSYAVHRMRVLKKLLHLFSIQV
ncbi:hypothetical protein ZIOFF_019320 [Zingiber officinale]|uniref:Uncharacterized protein n=1 Tax=Zingiber officinale TaxID=94328 RepID=A0A8J5HLU0_ZINOF|nr:hypothetical protein ZIOFF_019320 [Zingiber officinale]